MNPNLQKLFKIAEKPEKLIIGLMSGTSLDGLDIALCKFKGSGRSTSVEVLNFETHPYTPTQKTHLTKIFCKKTVDLQDICVLNAWLGSLHAEMLLESLKKWEIPLETTDLIASHGQTVYHAPKSLHKLENFPNSTLQISDGDHITVKTGIITVSDFRQKDIAAGGEGAPLAIYGDFILFSSADENRIMLNIGGIANYTFLPHCTQPNVKDLISTDTGPGNTLMDHYCRLHFQKEFDFNGDVAAEGKINSKLLAELKDCEFFRKELPRTTGQELFNPEFVTQAQERSSTLGIAPQDLISTLNQFTAETIAEAIRVGVRTLDNSTVFVSGGGVHNIVLINSLKVLLPECHFKDFSDLGIPPDAKEAVLFATLANESVCGGDLPWASLGKFCFPK